MMKFAFLCLVPGIAMAAARADRQDTPKAAVFTDSRNGYSFQPPLFPMPPKDSQFTAVVLLAPAQDGFSSNVNVTIQTVSMTLEEYCKLSADQFKAAGFKVNSESRKKVAGKDAVLWDYEGRQQGRDLRWLALAVIRKESILLATCTALKGRFEKLEKEFKACLDSLTVTE